MIYRKKKASAATTSTVPPVGGGVSYPTVHSDPPKNWSQQAPHHYPAGVYTPSYNKVDGLKPSYVASENSIQPYTPAAMQGPHNAGCVEFPKYAAENGGAGMQLEQQNAEKFEHQGSVPVPAASVAGASLNMDSASISLATASTGPTFTATSEGAGGGACRGIANHTANQALSIGPNVLSVHPEFRKIGCL